MDAMGLQYIWTDCYCIIQSMTEENHGSTADKLAQICDMNKASAKALFGLAACHGSNSHDPPFVERSDMIQTPE